MKYLTLPLILLFIFLQYELWFSASGVRQYFALREQISAQKQENAKLDARNQSMVTEINNLKQGHEAIEEHARNDLGMIKQGETYYQVVNK